MCTSSLLIVHVVWEYARVHIASEWLGVCSYTPALSRKVTHLVVASGIDNKGSEKLETARKKVASGAWKVVVVSVRWLQLCVTSSTLHPTAEHTISFEKRPQRSVDISGAGSGRPHPADSYVGASVALTAQCSSDLPSSCLQSKPRPESAPSTSRAQDFGTAQGSGRAAPVQSAAASSKSHDAPPVRTLCHLHVQMTILSYIVSGYTAFAIPPLY